MRRGKEGCMMAFAPHSAFLEKLELGMRLRPRMGSFLRTQVLIVAGYSCLKIFVQFMSSVISRRILNLSAGHGHCDLPLGPADSIDKRSIDDDQTAWPPEPCIGDKMRDSPGFRFDQKILDLTHVAVAAMQSIIFQVRKAAEIGFHLTLLLKLAFEFRRERSTIWSRSVARKTISFGPGKESCWRRPIG